jgi:hypothetical protein
MENLFMCFILCLGFIWTVSMLRDIVIELRYLNKILEKLTNKNQ